MVGLKGKLEAHLVQHFGVESIPEFKKPLFNFQTPAGLAN